jgi:hypothetical protein
MSDMDGTNLPSNLDIPEVEILSDSEESIWGLTDPVQHSPSFIQNELNWRQTEEDYRYIADTEQRNRSRQINLNVIISEIEALWEAGNDADFYNREWYDWNHHNQDLQWLERERQRYENAIVRAERNIARTQRAIRRSRRPPPRRRRYPRNLTNNFNVTNFERF